MSLMIHCTDKYIIEPEFVHIQYYLLYHKYLYYVLSDPMIDDGHFDLAERYSFTLAKNLGFKVDRSKGPEENEKHHVHWMVGFDENNVYWPKTKEKFNIK